jgi:UDP-GlcNAc:undecaprenyl-phosphate GlcNAc-1-phosphate transferase
MHILHTAAIVFFCCVVSLFYLRPIAIKFNLVDSPNERKSHNGHIPLVGGLSTLLGVWIIYLFMPDLLPLQTIYTLLASLLVLVGLIDDRFDISAISRLIVISLIAIWLVKINGISLSYLGDLLGNGEVILGGWSTLFTIFAVIGCITAFNMIDGIDGLLGALASVSIGTLGFMFWYSENHSISLFCFLLIISMLAYIFFNLSIKVKSKYKVFMGDSGSFLIGFSILWLLVFATQNIEGISNLNKAIKPVTALWIIAVPLMDMVLVMLRRIINKKSPILADRTHIHHVALRSGFTAKQALIGISLFALLLAIIGIILEISGVKESHSLFLFIATFFIYATASLSLQAQRKAVAS